jgi:hypothetical protein
MSKPFEWTDETAVEFANWYQDNQGHPQNPSHIGKKAVDAFREDWEKRNAPKPEYEITAVRYKPTGAVYTQNQHVPDVAYCLSRPDIYEIYTIKRTRDGEEFSIGDSFCVPEYSDKVFQIGKFSPNRYHEDVWMAVAKDSEVHQWTPGYLRKVEVKKPLFTTEDGVEIFEGDTFYEVSTERWEVMAESEPHKPPYDQYYKYFSTEKAARNYVVCNKPCLSFNDVWMQFKDDHILMSASKGQLQNLVEQKLKR